jgi:hypothetical protein
MHNSVLAASVELLTHAMMAWHDMACVLSARYMQLLLLLRLSAEAAADLLNAFCMCVSTAPAATASRQRASKET